ncbi:MAG: hypothetical protein QHJ82_09495 [Verrucomicrobiota bacterium]|nr:hypothetical protein [Verrucomicrobiota bacterium]
MRTRKRLMLRAVQDQLNSPDTPEVNLHYKRLLSMGYSPARAKGLIATVLAVYMWHILRGEQYTYSNYVEQLAKLPAIDWLNEEDEEV